MEEKNVILWLDKIGGIFLIESLLDSCLIDFDEFFVNKDYGYSKEDWMRDWAPRIVTATNILLQLREYFPQCLVFEYYNKETWEAALKLKDDEFVMTEEFAEKNADVNLEYREKKIFI